MLCPQDVLTVVVDDLRLCSVKPCEDIERRFCFEVVSPTKCVRPAGGLGLAGRACLPGLTYSPHRSCMLQADSEKLRQAWVQAVQASIASAYRESPDSCYSEVRPASALHVRTWPPWAACQHVWAGHGYTCMCGHVHVSVPAHVCAWAWVQAPSLCGCLRRGGGGGPLGQPRLELQRG